MTEPVAYWHIPQIRNEEIFVDFRPSKNSNFEDVPLYTAEQLHPRVKMTQAEFDELEISLINAQFDYSELKKTIEIVPDMKWFVRSKKTNGSYQYDYLSRFYAGTSSPKYGVKNLAIQFDTKEEAEKWTNPLTEAVQLPVEENND